MGIISIGAFECDSHASGGDIPNVMLIPATVRALRIPVIDSGGIADGRSMATALAPGAQGVNMGSRFLCTRKAPAREHNKQTLVAAGGRDSALILRRALDLVDEDGS